MTRRATLAKASVVAIAALTLGACTSQHRAASPTPSTSPSAVSPRIASPPSTVLSSPMSPVVTTTTPSASGGTSNTATSTPKPIWPTYHHDNARSGVAAAAPAVTTLKVAATAKLDGALYASPLVLRDATGPLVIAATENNTLYALRDDGQVVWSKHLGTPVDGSTLPCGNINPTGITGTPAYDAASGMVFAVAFLSGDKHVLVAVDAETGAVAWTRPVDAPGSHSNVEQQRPALLVSGGRVWIAYGGLWGDCGPYHGYLVGIATNGQGDAVIYQDPTTREGGFWAPTGPAADAAGHLYVPVGNGAATSPNDSYDMTDGVIELDGANVASYFAPSTWASDNAHDYGTTGVVLLPTGQVFINGKSGIAYLLKQGDLGGITANASSIAVCRAFGGPAYANGLVYVPCTDGVRAVRVDGPAMTTAWHASPAGSPVIGGGVVLSVDARGGTLYALDPASGAVRAKVALGDTATRFVAPAIGDDGHAYVGTQHGTLVVVATS